jgi:hypothetical protein
MQENAVAQQLGKMLARMSRNSIFAFKIME